MRSTHVLACAPLGLMLAGVGPGFQSGVEVWTFDKLQNIGGHRTTVLGHPRLIDTAMGKAVEFDGVGDGLMMDVHPLAGAATFTWEAIFRPDGGNAEQRWFHLEENPATGADENSRMLFEIRVIDDRWCLDAFNRTGEAEKALLNRQNLHELGRWFHVAALYDGREFRSYVNGVQDGAAEIRLAPQGQGRTAVGMRMNKIFYFKGAVRMARFTRRALAVAEFLKVPAKN
ncbi:MAG: LamG-like jellyroll fold domain-containing protein [Bryobacteraceae bacterium]